MTKNKHAIPRLSKKILSGVDRLQRNLQKNIKARAKSITLLPSYVLTPAEPHGPEMEYFRQSEHSFIAWTNKQIQTWNFCGQLKTIEGDRRFSFEISFGLRHTENDRIALVPLRWFKPQILSSQFLIIDSLNADIKKAHSISTRSSILPQSHTFVSYERVHIEQDGWLMKRNFDGTWTLNAHNVGQSLQLTLTPMKKQIYPGQYGFIQKSDETNDASLCCSYSLLRAKGSLVHNERMWDVYGDVWLDHEKWTKKSEQADSTPEQQIEAFLRLNENEELRLQLFLNKQNKITHYSFGTKIDREGHCTHFLAEDLILKIDKYWKSSKSKIRYPTQFTIEIPSKEITLSVRPTYDAQEVSSGIFLKSSWKGEVQVQGKIKDIPVSDFGFIEFTGFSAS